MKYALLCSVALLLAATEAQAGMGNRIRENRGIGSTDERHDNDPRGTNLARENILKDERDEDRQKALESEEPAAGDMQDRPTPGGDSQYHHRDNNNRHSYRWQDDRDTHEGRLQPTRDE